MGHGVNAEITPPRKEVVYLQDKYPDKYKGEELEGAPGTFRFRGTEPRGMH